MSQRSLAEQVAGVVERNTGPKQSGVIDRNRLTVILAAHGDLKPSDVDSGIELALERGLIEERDGGFAPSEL